MDIPPSDHRKPEHHHRLPAHSVLPLFDTLFGVALTLLAYSLPEHLNTSMEANALLAAVATYLLAGLAVIIYWYKLRRLIEISRILLVPQLLFGMASLLLIVLMPRLAQLVVYHGAGRGDLTHWTPSQIVNTAFLSCLLLFDGICLVYALSLLCESIFCRVKGFESWRRSALRPSDLDCCLFLDFLSWYQTSLTMNIF